MTGPVTERVQIDRLGVTRLPVTDVFTKAMMVTSYTGTVRMVGKQPASIYQNVALNLPTAGTLRMVGKQPTCAVTLNIYAAPQSGTLRVVPNDSGVLWLSKCAPSSGVLRIETGNSRIVSHHG